MREASDARILLTQSSLSNYNETPSTLGLVQFPPLGEEKEESGGEGTNPLKMVTWSFSLRMKSSNPICDLTHHF